MSHFGSEIVVGRGPAEEGLVTQDLCVLHWPLAVHWMALDGSDDRDVSLALVTRRQTDTALVVLVKRFCWFIISIIILIIMLIITLNSFIMIIIINVSNLGASYYE